MINCSLSIIILMVPKQYVNINEALDLKKAEVLRRNTVPELGGTG